MKTFPRVPKARLLCVVPLLCFSFITYPHTNYLPSSETQYWVGLVAPNTTNFAIVGWAPLVGHVYIGIIFSLLEIPKDDYTSLSQNLIG